MLQRGTEKATEGALHARQNIAVLVFGAALLAAAFSIPIPAAGREAGKQSAPGFPLGPDEFVVVCRDAGAGAYEAFPDVCRLSDGRLMAVFYAGYGHVALPTAAWPKGGRISACTSSDEGRTWSAPFVVFDGPDDDRDPSIVQLEDGRLLCNFFILRRSSDPKDPRRPWTGLGSWLIVSSDLGQVLVRPGAPHGRILLQFPRAGASRRAPDSRAVPPG